MKSIYFLTWTVLFSVQTLQAGNFVVNSENSEVLADAKASPPHTVTSYVRHYSCDLQVDPVSLKVTVARFAFNLADLDSENKNRDKKMHKWAESDRFPDAIFEMSEVTTKDDGRMVAAGTFSLHGISKAMEVPFQVTREGDKILVDGSASFNYGDWGLEIIRILFFTVKPELAVRFHLEGTLKDS